jgi:riboflavin kinase/FMN adenylyltransferase
MSPTDPASAERGAVACVGVFDGVHLGHRALLGRARERATSLRLPLTAVTFDPHPMVVVRPASAPTTLATLQRRLELLQEAGADAVHVLQFDEAMAAMSPEDFVGDVLVRRLRVVDVVVGENFRFGHRAAGNVETLRETGDRLGFAVTAVGLVGDDVARWSSTHARTLIVQGDVAGAALVLGRPYSVDGTVVHGDHRGRELGFPTANLSWRGNPTLPMDGVYAGWLRAYGQRLPAAISIGLNPQFNGAERRIEAYVLDRDDLDLYGHEVQVEFADRLRGQQTFPDLEAFVARMDEDVESARNVLFGHG